MLWDGKPWGNPEVSSLREKSSFVAQASGVSNKNNITFPFRDGFYTYLMYITYYCGKGPTDKLIKSTKQFRNTVSHTKQNGKTFYRDLETQRDPPNTQLRLSWTFWYVMWVLFYLHVPFKKVNLGNEVKMKKLAWLCNVLIWAAGEYIHTAAVLILFKAVILLLHAHIRVNEHVGGLHRAVPHRQPHLFCWGRKR